MDELYILPEDVERAITNLEKLREEVNKKLKNKDITKENIINYILTIKLERGEL